MDQALDTCEKALATAEGIGDRALVDLATCNRSYVIVTLGRGHEAVRSLQAILMSSSDFRTRHLAAYNLSLHYHERKDYERCFRYGRTALQHAERAGDPDLVARSHNMIAFCRLVDCYFEEASAEYHLALAGNLDPSEPEHAAILANLGYCEMVTGRTSDGFRALLGALRALRRLRRRGRACEYMLARTHLGLCYGYLEIERERSAHAHASAALALARGSSDSEAEKKALYLLGEAAKAAGNDYLAYEYFRRLQDEFHDENSQLADMLMATDTRNLINLMA